MSYLISSIKDIEDWITPPFELHDFFSPFSIFKFENQFKSCMKLYTFETHGEDYEKFPINFENFNPKYDKFLGLDYYHLEKIIDLNDFRDEIKCYLIGEEVSFIRDIKGQLQNPSEAQFKIFLYNTLKNLQFSYEFLLSTEIINNALLNIIKVELL